MSEIIYTPSAAGLDLHRYDIDARLFRNDSVAQGTAADIHPLASSPDWEDRIRAEVLRSSLSITLPDQFPCIYETADSPNHMRHRAKLAKPFAWVVSPDFDLLNAVLADYQELWDGYTAQWGPSARRTMAIGRLDGLSTHGVYRPGTTPEQVLGRTMLTHSDMYRHASERLKQMHPQHAVWQRAKKERAQA